MVETPVSRAPKLTPKERSRCQRDQSLAARSQPSVAHAYFTVNAAVASTM
jgi:hypothetical protein